jgi:pimeloyl-ACP methyl ester carboxylesterase
MRGNAMLVKFIDVDGVKTRCLIGGREGAYPILCIHGMTFTADVWLRNVDDLGRDYHVVAPDMLGHGFTNPGRTITGSIIPQKVDHICRLADSLGLDRFCVSGSSYGALIGTLAYFKMPDRVDKLIINGSGTAFNTEQQLVQYVDKSFNAILPTLTRSSQDMWRQTLARGVFDPDSIPEELTYMLMTCYAQPWLAHAWEQSMRELMQIDAVRPHRILDRLEEIQVETMVVWGREDPGAVYQNAVDAVKRMPRATLVTIEKCGHMIMFERPDAYNTAVRNFLGG